MSSHLRCLDQIDVLEDQNANTDTACKTYQWNRSRCLCHLLTWLLTQRVWRWVFGHWRQAVDVRRPWCHRYHRLWPRFLPLRFCIVNHRRLTVELKINFSTKGCHFIGFVLLHRIQCFLCTTCVSSTLRLLFILVIQ